MIPTNPPFATPQPRAWEYPVVGLLRVVVPYVEGMLQTPVRQAIYRELDTCESVVQFAKLDPSDHEAYWRLLRELWADGETTILVEHDVEPPLLSFHGFASCGEIWCAHPYDCNSGVPILAMGCTRFRSPLMRAVPDALDRAGEICDDSLTLPRRHWKRLDTRLARVLHEAGHSCHAHEPAAIHHHDYR